MNEAPTSIALSSSSVEENAKAGTVIGKVSGIDPERDKLTFALAEDDDSLDNERFQLKGTTLSSLEVFDADSTPNFTIKLVATDRDGLSFEKEFTITVGNLPEGPTDLVTGQQFGR